MGGITYALVAFNQKVLVESGNSAGTYNNNISDIAGRLLVKLNPGNARKSYTFESYTFHYISENGYIYLCVADASFGIRIPFAFLVDIQTKFLALFGTVVSPTPKYSEVFAKTLQERMSWFSTNTNFDAVSRIQKDIDDVKVIMERNIDKVLERGDKIEDLVDKTSALSFSGYEFKRSAVKLRRKMWWKNVACWFVLGGTILGLVAAVVLASLYFTDVLKF